ncbi:MAG: hypothetical protein E6H08_22550 [Bacteroidetes bacterium]|nr:MAG: hypothetical protein E6H08_22550 [Bacteroidota bacterium]
MRSIEMFGKFWKKSTVNPENSISPILNSGNKFLLVGFYVKESDPQEQHPGNNYSYNGPYSILYPFSFHARGWFKK